MSIERVAELEGLLAQAISELEGLPSSYGYEFTTLPSLRAALSPDHQAAAQPAPVAVPAGYKLVPVEPSPEMLSEFKRAYKEDDFWRERIHGAVCAMLAAAPQPPVQQAESAPAQDERAAFEAKFPIPAHCIRCGDSYAATEFHAWGAQEYSKIRQGWLAALEWQATRPAQSEQQQPIRLPQRADTSHGDAFDTQLAEAYNAALDEVARLNAAPIAQTAPSQPEQSEVQRLREALEKIAKISRGSIHYHPSYMSRIARSALDPKGFDPVEASMRSALSAHRAQQEGK